MQIPGGTHPGASVTSATTHRDTLETTRGQLGGGSETDVSKSFAHFAKSVRAQTSKAPKFFDFLVLVLV